VLFKILFPLLLFSIVLYSAPKQLTTPKETLLLLEELKDDAIVFGNGKKEIHSFIDPKCSVSQRYLKHLIRKKKKLFKRYKIYLYLYELKRKKSANIIQNIFDSDFPDILLKAIMVDKNIKLSEFDEDLDDEDINSKMERINQVAKKIGVYKRPYIITNGRGK